MRVLATALVALSFFTPMAFGQSAEDIQALQEQINELNKKLEALKAQQVATEAKAVEAEPAGNDIKVHWKEGLRLDSNNGDFKLKIGGRLQNDWGVFSEGNDLKAAGVNSQNGAEFRRARIYIGGTIYEDFEFKTQYDFAGGDADFKEVYIAANHVPVVGKVTVGHFKEAFGLENTTSDTNHTFLESSFINAFYPAYNMGVGISNTAFDNRMGYTLGLFKETTSSNEIAAQDSGGHHITGRLTGLPIWNEGESYLHLGASLILKDVGGNDYGPKSTAAAHLGDKVVGLLNTGGINNAPIAADSVDLFGVEAAYVRGAFHTQAEYQMADIEGDTGVEDADFNAYYAQAGYFLTGEHKAYKTSSGKFDKVRPLENFGWGENKGTGAWELAVRYSHVDMEDNGYEGGELTDYTVGINWYLNPNMKMMMDYVHGELEDGILGHGEQDDLDYLLARFQVTW